MTDPEFAPLLNQSQRRHLTVTLGLMDEALHKVEILVEETGASSPLAGDSLPPAFVAQAPARLARVRLLSATLADRFGLHWSEPSRRRSVHALLSTLMVRLEDSYAGKLHGYGPVHPELRDRLDPGLDALQAELGALQRLLAGPASPAPQPGTEP